MKGCKTGSTDVFREEFSRRKWWKAFSATAMSNVVSRGCEKMEKNGKYGADSRLVCLVGAGIKTYGLGGVSSVQ